MQSRILSSQIEKLPTRLRLWGFRTLVVLALIALAYYWAWWIQAEPLWLRLVLLPAAVAIMIQLPAQWWLYLRAEHRSAPGIASSDLTVDVFVTACNEPEAMSQKQ